MRTHGWAFLLLALMPLATHASICRPKDGRTLVIGHPYKLDWFTTFRLKNSARLLGYRIKFQDLKATNDYQAALRKVDAVLVPGGADINPSYYTYDGLPVEFLELINRFKSYYQRTSEGGQRDPYEYNMYRAYFTSPEFATLPALGICRGMQMMAVSRGIPLVQDLKAEFNIPNRRHRFDRFEVSDASGVMGELFPEGSQWGYKNHHQNPRYDYLAKYPAQHPEVKVTATSQQGRIVEAIEMSDRPALGVQFHPEKSFPYVKHRVFSWLLTSACERTHNGE